MKNLEQVIPDREMRGKIRKLYDFQPQIGDPLYFRDCLFICKGDVESAANIIFGSLPDEMRTAVLRLVKIDRSITEQEARAVFIECRGNFDDSVNRAKEYAKSGTCPVYESYVGPIVDPAISPFAPVQQRTSRDDVDIAKMGLTYNSSTVKRTTNGSSSKAIPSAPIRLAEAFIDLDSSEEPQETKRPAKADETLSKPPASTSKTVTPEDIESSSDEFSEAGASKEAQELYEILGKRVSLSDCATALFLNDNEMAEAINFLEEDSPNFWDSPKKVRAERERQIKKLARSEGIQGISMGQNVTAKDEKAKHAPSASQKRGKESQDHRVVKKQRGIEKEPRSSKPGGSARLEPASEWRKKYLTEDERHAHLILGPEGEVYNDIPRKVLYENSAFFRDKYDNFDGSEVNEEISLPGINPRVFDLAIQCLYCKNYNLEVDVGLSIEDEITLLLDLVDLSIRLGFSDPGQPVVDHLRTLLIQKRRSLTTTHIQRAYALEAKHPIQKLFAQAVIQQYMRRDREYDEPDEDEKQCYPDDDLDDAHAARDFDYGMRFRYIRESRSTAAFKNDLVYAVHDILSASEEQVNWGRKKTNRPQQKTTVFKDPLDGTTWSP